MDYHKKKIPQKSLFKEKKNSSTGNFWTSFQKTVTSSLKNQLVQIWKTATKFYLKDNGSERNAAVEIDIRILNSAHKILRCIRP